MFNHTALKQSRLACKFMLLCLAGQEVEAEAINKMLYIMFSYLFFPHSLYCLCLASSRIAKLGFFIPGLCAVV